MKFTAIVAMIATLSLAANAQEGKPTVVLIPSTSNVQFQQQQPTVVEAAPVSESKADNMRKARQNQEVQTEQKIVEKLEESRLKEEQQRAERLFGDKLDMGSGAAAAAPVQQPVQPAPQPVQPVQPVQQAPQVNIEKIEIVQPKEEKAELAPAPVAPVAPVAESKIEAEEEPAPVFNKKFYVGATLAAPSYSAANLNTNYGFGIIGGTLLDPNWAIEGMILFSNHTVNEFWKYPLFREMDQYDFQATAKYLIMTGKLKPYVGASAAYVMRRYSDREDTYNYNPNIDRSDSVDTYAVNVGLVAGVDFDITDSVTIGAGIDYNTPVMKKNDFNAQSFGAPENTKPVEDFDYTTIKANVRMNF